MEDNDIIVEGRLDSPYYTNKQVRNKIDDALRECAKLRTQVGTRQLKDENGRFIDDRGSDEAMQWCKMKENMILGEVEDLDPDFVSPLFYTEDSFDRLD